MGLFRDAVLSKIIFIYADLERGLAKIRIDPWQITDSVDSAPLITIGAFVQYSVAKTNGFVIWQQNKSPLILCVVYIFVNFSKSIWQIESTRDNQFLRLPHTTLYTLLLIPITRSDTPLSRSLYK